MIKFDDLDEIQRILMEFNGISLHLMGIDHTDLTYRYAGRDFRLTDVHGNIISDIII